MQRRLNRKKYIILIIHDIKEQKIFSMTFTINIPNINNHFFLWCGETFFWGKGKTGFCFWQRTVGRPRGAHSLFPSFNVLLFPPSDVPSYNLPRAFETRALLPRSLLIGQCARWHSHWHPVWVDCPPGAC